ncbi:MAG: hypothetical protein AAF558_00135 [Verrucomicrobiota bacterium]
MKAENAGNEILLFGIPAMSSPFENLVARIPETITAPKAQMKPRIAINSESVLYDDGNTLYAVSAPIEKTLKQARQILKNVSFMRCDAVWVDVFYEQFQNRRFFGVTARNSQRMLRRFQR